MATPTISAPSAPILPNKSDKDVDTDLGKDNDTKPDAKFMPNEAKADKHQKVDELDWDDEFVKLVWVMADSIRHTSPNIVAAMNKFKAKYGDELDEMFAPKDSPPVPVIKVDPLDSPNKPMK